MTNYTQKSYEMKRNITHFLSKLIKDVSLDKKRFIADMFKGILESQSLVVSEISRHLGNEATLKANHKRLSRHLKTFSEYEVMQNYLLAMKGILGDDQLFIVDDSDITKPYGNVFEDLGCVRDGSATYNTWKKGYWVSQIVGLTEKTLQPLPIAHQIYSQKERGFKSTHYYTQQHIELTIASFGTKSTFICDRGYDDLKLMQYINTRNASFIIRACKQRKYIVQGKKYTYQELIDTYKGTYKHTIQFQGDYLKRDVKLTVVPVTLLNDTMENLSLVIAYGLSDQPMLLITNRRVEGKEDAIKIFNCYMLRWRIEEFFRGIKQVYGFEQMRVQSLKKMNTLSWMLQFVMGYQAYFIEKQHQNNLFQQIISTALAYKQKVSIWLYQCADGMKKTLLHTRQNFYELLGLKRTSRNRMQLQLF